MWLVGLILSFYNMSFRDREDRATSVYQYINTELTHKQRTKKKTRPAPNTPPQMCGGGGGDVVTSLHHNSPLSLLFRNVFTLEFLSINRDEIKKKRYVYRPSTHIILKVWKGSDMCMNKGGGGIKIFYILVLFIDQTSDS